ncbi:peptidylprolyl isomerase [Crenalkalicoccus roseus]|uniref:peptidylprolyl isomerase n=1 Tax=Crenalkalicoccus roseus TaxID=1485588 RepID=UPI001080234C|nr:peptidylprolyl isomerase [Crenalkalicoccus roseus]
MLTALRRMAQTWVAKVLFALLIVSFAVWGIGDTVRNYGRDTAVARVAGEPVEMEEAQLAVRREMLRLSRALGPQFEADPTVRGAIARQAVDSLVMDRVLRWEAERLRLAVPDEAVRDFIFTLEGFRGPDGRFSRPLFESFLRNNGLTEGEFLALVRADLARQQMTGAVRSGAAAPETLARPLLRWELEQRAALVVSLPLAEAPEPPAPTGEALRRFHENNPALFSAPEYRDAVVAVLSADRIIREVEVPEAEIAAAFAQRRDQFEVPERRALQQALVDDPEQARAIARAWREGAGLDEIAAQAQAAGGQAIALGSFARAELPLPELAEAAFSLPEGGVSEPVQSPLGWHVVRVERVEPPQRRTLDEVRGALRDELAHERAADLAFERANRVEDALAGGATLEEVANRFNLGFARVRTDAAGLDPEGRRVALPVIEEAREPLLHTIFATEPGAMPRLQETEAGFVGVQILEVVPPALRPFEAVEAEVREAWARDARRRAQEEAAAALLAAVRDGRPLGAAAQEAGLGWREVGGLRRDPRQAAGVPPELLGPLFELPLHQATMVETPEGFVVAQVTEIIPADPDAAPEALGRLRAEVGQTLARDLEVQFLAALRERADVRVNPRLVEQLARP